MAENTKMDVEENTSETIEEEGGEEKMDEDAGEGSDGSDSEDSDGNEAVHDPRIQQLELQVSSVQFFFARVHVDICVSCHFDIVRATVGTLFYMILFLGNG